MENCNGATEQNIKHQKQWLIDLYVKRRFFSPYT